MAVTFTQTGATETNCTNATFCSGLSANGTVNDFIAKEGGSTSASATSLTIDADASALYGLIWYVEDGTNPLEDFDGATGDWTFNLNVTTSNMFLSWTGVDCCQIDDAAGCTNKATICSDQTLAIDLGSTGNKTSGTIAQGSPITMDANDEIAALYSFDNSSGMAQAFGYDKTLTIASDSWVLAFNPSVDAYRFYDDGTEDGSSPLDAEDTDVTINNTGVDAQFHLRYLLQENGGGTDGAATDDWQLQVNKNSGGWVNVTASSSNVKADTASGLTDGDATTNRASNGISDGSGSFLAGIQEEADGAILNYQITKGDFTEHVFALLLIAADTAHGDSIDFRVTLNGGDPGLTNNVTPTVTVEKDFTPELDAFRWYENDGDETADTPRAAEDTDYTVDKTSADSRKNHLRVRIQETTGGPGSGSDSWQLQYSHNSGSWTNVTSSSSVVDSHTTSLLSGSLCTNRADPDGITDGTGSFVTGVGTENDAVFLHELTSADFTEHIFALEVVADDVADGDTIDFRVTLNGGTPGLSATVTPRLDIIEPLPDTTKFRFYEDGTEDGSTPLDAENTDVTINNDSDAQFHLRLLIQNQGGADTGSDSWQLEYNKNAGGWFAVLAASSNVKTSAGGLTDDAATTNRASNGITDGTGSFVAGVQEEDDGLISHDLTASNFTEHVFSCTLIATDNSDGDTFDFRLEWGGGATEVHTVIPRITISKVGGPVEKTITTVLDALVTKQDNLLTASLDALVTEQDKTVTVDLDALVAQATAITTSLDGLVTEIGRSSTTELDALVQELNRTVTANLDGLVTELDKTVATELDGFVTDADKTSTADLDALITGLQTVSTSLDALINEVGRTTVTNLDAIVSSTAAVLTSLDALVSELGKTQTTSLDAFVTQLAVVLTTSLDAFVSRFFTETTSLDAVVQGLQTQVTNLDALVNALGLTTTTQLDAAVKKLDLTLTTELDAFVSIFQARTTNLDAFVQELRTSTTSLDGLVKELNRTVTTALDAIIIQEVEGTVTTDLDAVVQGLQSISTSLDALVKELDKAVTTELDALIFGTLTTTTDLDGFIQKLQVITTSLDGLVIALAQTVTTSLDAFVAQAFTKTVNLDALVLAAQAITTDLDALVRGAQTITTSLDAIIFQGAELTTSLDGLVQGTETTTTSLDGILQGLAIITTALDGLVKKNDNLLTLSLDAYVAKVFTLTTSTDAFILKELLLSSALDALALKSLTTTSILDAILRGASNLTPITRTSEELVVTGLISEELDVTLTSDELDVLRESKRNT